MLKRLMISHWTVVAIGFALIVAHAIWFYRSSHQADVISGFGVSVAVLGLLVAAQPFIREGVQDAARRQVGLAPRNMETNELERAAEQEAIRYVLKERVFGVVLIALGTLLNGYANAIARCLSFKV